MENGKDINKLKRDIAKLKFDTEFNIYNSSQSNTVYKICKTFNVDKKKVKKIIDKGTWYLDLISNEIVFTATNITKEEQFFHYLCYTLEKQTDNLIPSILSKKKIHTRVVEWLKSQNFTKVSSYSYWLKKPYKLVKYDKDKKEIDTDIKELGNLILETELQEFKNSYKYDELGYPTGYKLWYIDLYTKPYFILMSLEFIKDFITFKGTEKQYKLIMEVKAYQESRGINDLNISLLEFDELNDEEKEEYIKKLKDYKREKHIKNFFLRFNIKLGIILGTWGKNLLKKGYSLKEIMEILNRRCVYNDSLSLATIENDVPRIIYMELKAYYENIISQEMKSKVEETFI